MNQKTKIIISAGYVAIVLFTVLAILIGGRNYTVYIPNPYRSDKTTIEYSLEGVITNTKVKNIGDY